MVDDPETLLLRSWVRKFTNQTLAKGRKESNRALATQFRHQCRDPGQDCSWTALNGSLPCRTSPIQPTKLFDSFQVTSEYAFGNLDAGCGELGLKIWLMRIDHLQFRLDVSNTINSTQLTNPPHTLAQRCSSPYSGIPNELTPAKNLSPHHTRCERPTKLGQLRARNSKSEAVSHQWWCNNYLRAVLLQASVRHVLSSARSRR